MPKKHNMQNHDGKTDHDVKTKKINIQIQSYFGETFRTVVKYWHEIIAPEFASAQWLMLVINFDTTVCTQYKHLCTNSFHYYIFSSQVKGNYISVRCWNSWLKIDVTLLPCTCISQSANCLSGHLTQWSLQRCSALSTYCASSNFSTEKFLILHVIFTLPMENMCVKVKIISIGEESKW